MNERITSITYISFDKVDKLWVNNQNEIHKVVSERQSVFYLISVLTAKKCKELEHLESCKWRKKGRKEGHLFMGRTDKGELKHQSPCSPTAHSSGPADVEGKKGSAQKPLLCPARLTLLTRFVKFMDCYYFVFGFFFPNKL